MISTAGELISALGGSAAVADMFGVGTTAVSNWRVGDAFPERLHYRLFKEAEQRKLTLAPGFFERMCDAPSQSGRRGNPAGAAA